MLRAKCQKHGHKWVAAIDAWVPPVQFCSRWFCEGRRANPLLPAELQAELNKYARY